MRKTVIDGSNTTGFQRTCVIALGGAVTIGEKEIPIQHISLEEDAARKIGEEGSTIRYRIDRLGIPLIEVATAPVLYSPQEAEKIALAIGRIIRATGKARRGLGTIRQDLNISIRDGALIEIKGVQELELVSKVVENEVHRQLNLLRIGEELKKRGVEEKVVVDEFVDVSSVFKETKCKVIQRAIKEHKKVLAVKLPKFGGLLKKELAPSMRLGAEMADIARFWGRIGGIFHSDETPAYGVTEKEMNRLKSLMRIGPQDAVVFVAHTLENATDALKGVTQRARDALKGIPEETRGAKPDGSTRYLRPRPGASRMYPETDVPPIQLNEEHLEKIRTHLPELPEQRLKRLIEKYEINQKLARQIIDSEYSTLFEVIVKDTKVSATVVAATLTETLKALKREDIEVEKVTHEQIREVFRLLGSGETVKEAIPEIVGWLSKHEGASVNDAIKGLGLRMISKEELELMIESLLKEHKGLIEKRGKDAFGALMGIVMEKVRGHAKARLVSKILMRRLNELLK